jgi:CHAT domain-containing protein/tetratricopeptide (TPR) repeat protein
MRNARSTTIAVLAILFLFRFCNISGSINFSNQKVYAFPVDTVIENLIFNALYDQAIVVADKTMDQITDSNSKMLLLLKLSEIYIYKNNPEKAAEILQEVALKKNASSKPDDRIEFLYSLDMAMLLRESGKNEEAGKWMKKSEFFLKKIKNPNHSDASRLYNILGKHSYETRDSIHAIGYFSKSINILSENSLPEKMAKITSVSYLQLAYLFSENVKMAKQAEAKADSAYLTIAKKNHPSLLDFYLNLSYIYLNYSLNINKAESALHFASAIINKYYSSADPDYGLLFCYKGQLAYQEHDSEKALGYFRQAETYLVKNQELSPYMYLLYFDLANTYYFYKNDFHKAIENYRKVIDNNNQWLKRAYINSMVLSGYCYLELGDTAKAISCVKNGINAAESGSRVSGREKTYTYRCLAGLYMNMGQVELAHQYFQKAYKKANDFDIDWYLKTDIITNLANYHRDKGDIQTSLKLYQTAVDNAFNDSSVFDSGSQFCDEIELIEILNNMGYALLQLYEKQDKNYLHLKDALLCQKTAIRLIEKRLGFLDNESSEYNWLALLQTTFNNAVLYSTLLYNLTHDISFADAGYQYAEKSRMMIILIASRDKKIKKYRGVPDSLIQREILVHNEILNLQNQLYQCERTGIDSQEQKLISDKLAKIQLENDQLKSFFESNYNRYFDLKYNLNVISLNQLRENLSKNQILLEYQLLENELIIIAISKDHITMKLITDKGNEKQSINKFYGTISENPSNKDPDKSFKEFTGTSHHLYSWLIEPIKEEIENKRLIIIPHNELNLVPFELLISELPPPGIPENYKSLSYLIKRFPISYGYSGTLLFEETKLHPGKTAAFFIPDYSNAKHSYDQNQFLNLKGTQEEARKARDLIGGDIFSGNKANETRFKLFAGEYKILHIASHTCMDEEIPTLSSLELTSVKDTFNDGILYSYELYQLQLNAQLIVLSGCNTGMGLLKLGEGLLSLSRSFFFSGARSVAYTLWPQADQTGADIIIRFYTGIKNKKRLESALQSAKLNYLSDADPAKSHPYYWGGFLIVGKTDPIILNTNWPKMTIILILLCAGVGGLTYRKFRS